MRTVAVESAEPTTYRALVARSAAADPSIALTAFQTHRSFAQEASL